MEETDYKIFISEEAAEQVKLQLIKRGSPNAYLRLGVKSSGCIGFKYHLEFEDNLESKDLLFNINGVSILIDKKSILYLNGSTLDWERSLMNHGFKFINNLEKSRCGCSKSFSV